MVILLLAPGFEESEAIVPCDLMRRAGIDVQTVAVQDSLTVEGSHGIRVCADMLLRDLPSSLPEMLVLPGGLRGVENLKKSSEVLRLIRETWNGGKFLAAICAAPTILSSIGITDQKQCVCYPGMEQHMDGASVQNDSVCRDGNLITGRAAGSSFAFGLALVSAIKGTETARKVASGAVIYGEKYV